MYPALPTFSHLCQLRVINVAVQAAATRPKHKDNKTVFRRLQPASLKQKFNDQSANMMDGTNWRLILTVHAFTMTSIWHREKTNR